MKTSAASEQRHSRVVRVPSDLLTKERARFGADERHAQRGSPAQPA